jgi:ubiquitin carboxyl-terminal hydrolase 10
LTSQPASENAESTNPTTPSSIQQPPLPAGGDSTPVAPKQPQKSTVPVVPAIPKTVPREAPRPASEDKVEETQKSGVEGGEDVTKLDTEQATTEEAKEVAAPKAWTTPKLWTGLFNPAAATSTAASSESGRAAATPGFNKTNSESLAEALRSFTAVSPDSKVAFLEPRGLVNTGNMCYMNSVGGLILLL